MEYLIFQECQSNVVTEDWFTPELLTDDYSRYFTVEFDLSVHRWSITTNAYIGAIPLSVDYGVQIRPKSGLANITYMLYRSGLLNRSLETPFDQTVPYQIPEDDMESFFEGLILSFLEALDEIKRWGLLRETIRQSKQTFTIRGKTDHISWIRRASRNGGFRPPVPQLVFTTRIDNLPNRTLYSCLKYLASSPLQYVRQDDILTRLEYFNPISPTSVSADELAQLESQVETGRFPANRYYYLPALNLALLIFRGAGLALADQQDIWFKPILVNTANMFERYVRAICQEAVKLKDAHAENGKAHPIEFYTRSPKPISVMPDILVRRGGTTLSVLDVKYKFEPTAQDHYQMWAYMHAHQIRCSGFISIAKLEASRAENPVWFKRGEYAVFDYAFDCRKIKQSEQELKDFLTSQLDELTG